MKPGRQKDIIKQELEQDWYPTRPGAEPDSRLKRLMSNTDTRQMKLIEMTHVPDEIPEPNFSTVYTLKNKLWQATGFRCLDCGKVFAKANTVEKHPLVCNRGLKINKEEEQYILSRVKQNANKKD